MHELLNLIPFVCLSVFIGECCNGMPAANQAVQFLSNHNELHKLSEFHCPVGMSVYYMLLGMKDYQIGGLEIPLGCTRCLSFRVP